MSRFLSLFGKSVTDARKWMGASTRVISGGDAQRPTFSNGEAIKHYSSWIYAAANLNAYAVASQPLRLYVRNRSAGTKLWNTRRTARRTKAYLSGSLDQLPSRYAMTKAAEYGDDYEVVTDTHPVLDLLSKANPWQNGFEQTVLRVLYLELTGNAYLHPVLDRRLGIPVELWTMPAPWVEIVPGKEEFIDGYLYGVSYEKRAFFEVDEVIHFKRPNPKDIYYGMGKVEAAWGAATNNQSLHDMDYHWFANKARPDYLLTIKGDASQEEIERFEAQIDSKLRGTRRTGRFLTATADIDLKPLSFSPKDMMGREQIVEEIAAVFGVPVSMLKANDPNLASATVGFTSWKATSVLPLMRMDEEVLNQTLLPMFGIEEDAFLAYDNPVVADEKFESEKRRAYVAGGIITANEAREMEGLEAVAEPAASKLLINGQPLGGQPAQPAASPFAGLFGATAAQPRQDAALTFGAVTDTPDEPFARTVAEATETKAIERKDALGDCVSEKIPKLLDEGYPQDQAVAIAYSMCQGKGLEESIGKAAVGDIDTKPPASVADNARRALEVRESKPESQRGMTEVGIARARDLANRANLSEDTIRRMVAYFERHQKDKQGETWDEQGKGWQAWNGWGGDEGWSWARGKVEEFDRAREKKSCGCGCDERELKSPSDTWLDALADMDLEDEDDFTKNCGVGSEGFEEGNTCAGGGSGGGGGGAAAKPAESAKPSKPSKPKEPKSPRGGKPPKGSAPAQGLDKPKAEHTVKLPANPRRLNIDEATAALRQMGYTQGKMEFEGRQSFVRLSDSSGNTTRLPISEVTNFIYANSSDPADNARPAVKPRKSANHVISQKSLWSAYESIPIHTKASKDDAQREFDAMTEDEKKIARGVAGVFDRQVKDLIRRLEAHSGAPTAALITEVEQALRSRKWNKELTAVLRPFIQTALENGVELGLDTVAKVATTANFEVEKADLRAYAQSESVRLASRAADSVNRYTEVRVADMLGNGIAEGETIPELANRVRAWSEQEDGGSVNGRRAVTIARTEANRATRVAETEAWKATGAVEGKTWLLAPDPCEFCEAAAAQFSEKSVGLNDAFFTKDSTLRGADGGEMVLDYEDIQGPPLHPNCRCSMQPKLRDDLEQILGGMEAEIEEEARKLNLAEG